MISAAQLAAMRMAAQGAMDTSITISRASRVEDATGHQTDTWATVATVNGNLAQPTAAQLQNYDYLIGDLATWQVRLPVGTDVRARDRLTVGGQTLDVQIVLSPQSYQTAVRVLASEIKQQG